MEGYGGCCKVVESSEGLLRALEGSEALWSQEYEELWGLLMALQGFEGLGIALN